MGIDFSITDKFSDLWYIYCMVHIDEQDVTQKEEDYSYLELGLPKYLQESLNNYKIALEKIKKREKYNQIDCDFCELQADINSAEVEQEITSTQANYLRRMYLYD